MKKQLLYITALFLVNHLFSQKNHNSYKELQNTIPQELVHLTSDSNIFLSGEQIHFDIYLTNEKYHSASNVSKIIYVKLIGPNNSIIDEVKIPNKNGMGYGKFLIPSTIKTGNYKLLAYTNWSLNNRLNQYDFKDLVILNPYSTKKNKLGAYDTIHIKKSDYKLNTNTTSSYFSIHTNKKQYNKRDKVELSLSALSNIANGAYSISVQKMDPVELINHTKKSSLKKEANSINESEFYLPEIRGEIISGQIIGFPDHVPKSKLDVTLSFPGENFETYVTKTDENGIFNFIINNFHKEDAVVQLLESNNQNLEIVLDKKHPDIFPLLSFKEIYLDPNIEQWLTQRSIHNQIQNAFLKKQQDSLISNSFNNVFFAPIEKKYVLDDYTRFTTIKETFAEIIPRASINNHNEFKILDNPIFKFNELNNLPVLVLFDGIIIEDPEDIISYNSLNLESISVIDRQYVFGSKIYSGIISFVSKDKNFRLPDNSKGFVLKEDISIVSDGKVYYQPNYSTEDLKRIPDYRRHLFWKSSLIFDKVDMKEFEFFTSDIPGIYQITVKGINSNGEFIQALSSFEVLNK